MDFPKIKKRIVDFIKSEDGKISKQSLISMGAFLTGAVIGSFSLIKPTNAQTFYNITYELLDKTHPSYWQNDVDWEGGKDGANVCQQPGKPNLSPSWPIPEYTKDGPKVDPTIGHNAYFDNGIQKFLGNGECGDDSHKTDGLPFHFNGVDVSFVEGKLTAQHMHHGSHNSY